MTNYIVQIRCEPASVDQHALAGAVCEAVAGHDGALVFFHGEGIRLARTCVAEAERRGMAAGADWCVCRTSWSRRYSGAAPGGRLHEASLVALFEALNVARRVDSYGVAGAFCSRRPAGASDTDADYELLLEIGFAPAGDLGRTEALEIALAAAALEVDARVLFSADGVRHLAGEKARAWRQITDFELLDLSARSGRRDPEAAVPVRNLDSIGAGRLRCGAATIMVL